VSIVLASILLSVTAFAQVSPSQSGAGDDDGMMRHLVQHFMRVGAEQYERGYYVEAEKTLQMAQGYGQYLEPVERRKLDSMLEKAGLAAIERKRALEAKKAGEEQLANGQAVAGRANLVALTDNQFLTEKERAEVAETIRRAGTGSSDIAPAAQALVASAEPVDPPATESRAGDALDRFKTHIADLYYQSVKAYHAGDYDTARAGFAKVLDSGLMPATMTQTIQGYLQDMDGASPGAGSREPITLSTAGAPASASYSLAGMPAVYPTVGQPQSERQRIEQLYNRSWELYSQGELEEARAGFVEVAQSGLFSAPEGRRPEDYIATIDRLQMAAQNLQATPLTQPVVTPETPMASDSQGGFIEVINRRRNIIRSHMEAVVNDAVSRAQTLMAQGQFEQAREPIDEAQRLVNQNQLHLGDELYRLHSNRLRDVLESIAQAQTDREKQLAEQKRLEAIEDQARLREQAETDRQQRISELMTRAKAYWKQQRYEAALGQVESILAIDPLHDDALTLKQQLEDMIYMRKQIALDKEYNRQRADIFMKTAESGIPYAEEVTYPKNWREISERRKPDEPIGLDPESMRVYQQLDTIVDLSALSPEMPLSEAIEIIRGSVEPPLSIVVLWRDLYDNAEIEPSTRIDMDGLPKVRLGIALENLMRAITPATAFSPVDYVVNKGVVTVGTENSLPTQKMETRVYDITDLVGEPANYGGMQGLMTGMMMGMMGTMMTAPQGGGTGDQGGGGGGGLLGGSDMWGSSGTGSGGMGGGMGGGMMGGGMMGGGMMGGGMGMGMGGMGGGGTGVGGRGGGMGRDGGGGGVGVGGGGGSGMGGGGMMGGGGYASIMMAQSLRQLIQESIDPLSWYELSDTGEGTIMVYPTQSPKKLAVYQTPEVHQQIATLLDQLRTALGYQVSIEARFLVVSENFLEDVGLDVDFSYNFGGRWGLMTVTQDSSTAAAPDSSTKVPGSLGALTMTPAAGLTGGYGSVLDDLQVSFLLRATQARTDSKALVAPKVTVLSGESATFSLNNTVTYALPPDVTQSSAVGGTGATATTQGIYQNIGLVVVGSNLSVSPTITKDKKNVLLHIVTLQNDLLRFRTHDVEAVVSDNATTDGGTGGQIQTVPYQVTVPETEASTVMTRVSVPDGGTLLLGGHKITAEVDKEVGVPVLSKIPLVGRLFSNRSTIRDNKILLILVKPTIILQEEREADALAALEAGVAEQFQY